MANFGFRELVLVAPHDPVWQEARSAIGAEQIIASAHAVEKLTDGIGEADLVIGTTSGSRRTLDRDLIALTDLSGWLRRKRRSMRGHAALLFGSEKTGLSAEHLSYCHVLVRIPTTSDCPSMNLGQAVAVCCYELARSGLATSQTLNSTRGAGARIHLSEPANLHSLEHVLERAVRVLGHVGYLRPKSRNAQIIKLRRTLLDLSLTNNDVRILGGILAQIEWKLHNL